MLSLAAHRKGHHKIEIKKEPVKRMSDLFFNKKFYMFDADVLDDFVREINSFVKVEMFNKGNIFIKYAERLTILFFSNVVFVSRGMHACVPTPWRFKADACSCFYVEGLFYAAFPFPVVSYAFCGPYLR